MIAWPATTPIFLAVGATDLRLGFDGLAQQARDVLHHEPLRGGLFVFANRRRDRIKILYWDGDGYALWSKRLERGGFRWPQHKTAAVALTTGELAAILGGIDLTATRRRLRYVRPVA